ncbi:MAG: 50S ribosome-binding GTPase, partial [Desulfobacterales bacterium]|nr:50S ribosome-binding GTPase [Desulfobacterales bacterium]
MPEVTIAITAIPNSGKTTLFNRLTGANQTVGNWPGVSVEKKVGRLQLNGFHVQLVDLPGAYSITP